MTLISENEHETQRCSELTVPFKFIRSFLSHWLKYCFQAAIKYFNFQLEIAVYIQHSERQQLGLESRFLKYSEIQGEREKMTN